MMQAFYSEGLIIVSALERAKKTIQQIDNEEFLNLVFTFACYCGVTILVKTFLETSRVDPAAI